MINAGALLSMLKLAQTAEPLAKSAAQARIVLDCGVAFNRKRRPRGPENSSNPKHT